MAISNNGRYGYSVKENTVLTFQMGSGQLSDMFSSPSSFDHNGEREGYLTQISGYNVLSRGADNRQIQDVARNIKSNRLLPEVIEKQVRIMFGMGLHVYRPQFNDKGKLVRKWEDCPEITNWLRSWNDYGITDDYQDFAQACIRRFYYFEDYFVKWRFLQGKHIGMFPVAGLEIIENSRCLLASSKPIDLIGGYTYDDFTHILVGSWGRNSFKAYPRFKFSDVSSYNVAVSHHANDDVDSIYGRNKSYGGSREWLMIANENPRFIRSFLRNALAAKVHVVIPNEWLESKRKQIQSLCEHNRTLKKEGKEPIKFNGIEIGTQYNEELLIRYTNVELTRLTEYLSGADNQGKMFSTFSFRDIKGEEIKWKIEQVDLKYKEYIESLISIDRRADEVLLSAKGIDPSISNVSKEGVISKSGSDSYYNYIIYQDQLMAPEKICCDAINMAIKVNFPHLWKQGYQVGFYRNVPSRQQDVSESNRITSTEND